MLDPLEKNLRKDELNGTLCTGNSLACGVFELSGTSARGKDINSRGSYNASSGKIERPL